MYIITTNRFKVSQLIFILQKMADLNTDAAVEDIHDVARKRALDDMRRRGEETESGDESTYELIKTGFIVVLAAFLGYFAITRLQLPEDYFSDKIDQAREAHEKEQMEGDVDDEMK